MAAKRTYTDKELSYIKKYYPRYSTSLIAKELGFSYAKVAKLANEHGITKVRHGSKKAPKKRKPTAKEIEAHNNKAFAILANYDWGFKPVCGTFDTLPQEDWAIRSDGYITPIITPPRKNWLQRLVSWLLTGEA